MKNLILTLAFITAATFQLFSSNAPKSSFFELRENEKSVILNLAGVDAKANFFTITNSEGEILIKKDLEDYNDIVKFNLSKLPNGSYTIKIIGDHFIEYHETLVSESQVRIEKTDYHFRPSFRLVEKKILVNTVLADNEEINVSIYDTNGDLVYNFYDQTGGGFQKSFNLEQLVSGDYKVIVSTDYFSKSGDIKI